MMCRQRKDYFRKITCSTIKAKTFTTGAGRIMFNPEKRRDNSLNSRACRYWCHLISHLNKLNLSSYTSRLWCEYLTLTFYPLFVISGREQNMSGNRRKKTAQTCKVHHQNKFTPKHFVVDSSLNSQ